MTTRRMSMVLTGVLLAIVSINIAHAQVPMPVNADARQQRISKNLVDYPTNLDDQEKAQVIANCKTAQTNLARIQTRLDATKADRQAVYSRVDLRLLAVQKRLSKQEIDTSVIDQLLINYRKSTTAFDEALLAYEDSLSDITTMDCAADPNGFRATLEAVRAARKRVSDAAVSIQDYANTQLTSGFDNIKNRLEDLEKQNAK